MSQMLMFYVFMVLAPWGHVSPASSQELKSTCAQAARVQDFILKQ